MKGGMFVKSLFVASVLGVSGGSCTESRDDKCQVIDTGVWKRCFS